MKTPKPNPFDIYALPFRRKKKSSEYDIYPGLNRRMTAVTFDSILMLLASPIFNWLAPVNTAALNTTAYSGSMQITLVQILQNKPFVDSWVHNFFVQMIGFMIYSAICWYLWSATPGKMLMRMKIVDAKTQAPISPLQIVMRNTGYILSCFSFMMGIFWIACNKRHRAWHDYLADTVVINAPLVFWRTPQTPPPQPQDLQPDETITD